MDEKITARLFKFLADIGWRAFAAKLLTAALVILSSIFALEYWGNLRIVDSKIQFGGEHKPSDARSMTPAATPISIRGKWNLTIKLADGRTREGEAFIFQDEGSVQFSIIGEFECVSIPAKRCEFSSLVGVIADRDVFFMYESNQTEKGGALAKASENKPKSLRFTYHDFATYDNNADTGETMTLKRIPEN